MPFSFDKVVAVVPSIIIMAYRQLVVREEILGIVSDGKFDPLTNFSFQIMEHVKAKKWSGYLATLRRHYPPANG